MGIYSDDLGGYEGDDRRGGKEEGEELHGDFGFVLMSVSREREGVIEKEYVGSYLGL